MQNHFIIFYPSPLGFIQIDMGESGLSTLTFLNSGDSTAAFQKTTGDPADINSDLACQLIRELDAYFRGELHEFSIEINWNLFSGFQKEVLALTATIPYGEVWTYRELARKLGKPGGARAVGNALGANLLPILIPCHRVIGSDRHLRGYAGGLDAKRFLLTLEGLQIKGDRVIDRRV